MWRPGSAPPATVAAAPSGWGFSVAGGLTPELMWASSRFEDFSLQGLEWRGGEVVLKSGRRDVGVPGVVRKVGVWFDWGMDRGMMRRLGRECHNSLLA